MLATVDRSFHWICLKALVETEASPSARTPTPSKNFGGGVNSLRCPVVILERYHSICHVADKDFVVIAFCNSFHVKPRFAEGLDDLIAGHSWRVAVWWRGSLAPVITL